MIAVSDIPEEELLLARLAGEKLAKLLGGMLSVGLSALHFDSPEAFLMGKNKLILAMLEVLRHTGVRPGSESAIDFNQRMASLSKQVDDFFNDLMTLAPWRGMNIEEVQRASLRLAASYSASLATLQELLHAFGDTDDYRSQQMKGQQLIDCGIPELSKRM